MIITGNFINKSANKTGWKTENGSLIFSGPGTHNFKTGSDNSGSFTDNFAWGSLMAPEDGVLRLQGHLYAEAIKGVMGDPATKKITKMTGFCGIGIYYDPALSQGDLAGMRLFNPWGRQVGQFTDTGFVSSCK